MYEMKIFGLCWKVYVLVLVCSEVQRKHGLSLPPNPQQITFQSPQTHIQERHPLCHLMPCLLQKPHIPR